MNTGLAWPESLWFGLKLSVLVIVLTTALWLAHRAYVGVCGWLARRELRRRRMAARMREVCSD